MTTLITIIVLIIGGAFAFWLLGKAQIKKKQAEENAKLQKKISDIERGPDVDRERLFDEL